jgi:DNA-binding transcriptional ArsR family regulator
MNANTCQPGFDQIRRELENNEAVSRCAIQYGNMGDPTSMKACYLLRHYPELSVSQISELIGVSVSAASRCLKRLNRSEVVTARKEGQAVYYRLQENEFTRTLANQLTTN